MIASATVTVKASGTSKRLVAVLKLAWQEFPPTFSNFLYRHVGSLNEVYDAVP